MEVFSNANDFTPYVPYEPRFQASSSPENTSLLIALMISCLMEILAFYGLIFISDFVKKYL